MEPACRLDVPDPLLGRDFGGVVLVRVLGEGGMGRIYEGLQQNPERPVAVKVMRPGLFSQAHLKRFLREAQILGRLQHPAVAQIFAAGTFEFASSLLPYFVMELVPEALTITQFAAERGLSFSERAALFRKVCEAVDHGHRQGIIHRDLKPGNVLVDRSGHPKVIDFGVAQWRGTDDLLSNLTGTNQLIGSVQYMSPEQFASDPAAVGIPSDIYALGVILYELLTGRPPYELSGKGIAEAAKTVQHHRHIRADGVDPRIPPRLADIAATCLAKDPAARFPDIPTLLTALDHGMHAAPGRWLPRLNPAWRRRTFLMGSLVAVGLAACFISAERFAPLPLQEWRFGFRTVLQEGADRWLVEAIGMRKWEEKWMNPSVSYWGPAQKGTEGRLVYRFEFPSASRRIRVRLTLSCFSDYEDVAMVGRGAAAIEVSKDGTTWLPWCDNLSPPSWGADCVLDADMPSEVLGAKSLWLRMRFLMEGTLPRTGYAPAQFGRSSAAADLDVFEIEAICAPPGGSKTRAP